MEQPNQMEQQKKPKERFYDLLLKMFELIEPNVNEGILLQFADLLKDSNEMLDDLTNPQIQIIRIVQEARNNFYYRHYVRKQQKKHNRLKEADKAKNPHYTLCFCGRFCDFSKREYVKDHFNTLVHIQGIRNKKLSVKKRSVNIEEETIRDINLNAFCLLHLHAIKSKKPEPEPVLLEDDTEDEKEPEPEPQPRRRGRPKKKYYNY